MKKLLSLALAVVLVLSCACVAYADDFSYPTTEFPDVTLDYWVYLNSNVSASAASLNDTLFAQYVQEETGIKVNYIHPTFGAEAEGFSLLLASNDLPDIIGVQWTNPSVYAPGLDAAISNGLVLDMTGYEEYMPNYMATLASNEVWNKAAHTDSGALVFQFIRGDVFTQVYGGMIIRQDWLDELGLDVPVTIDDWTEMLTKFRDEKGATTPLITRGAIPNVLTGGGSCFAGAFGVADGFYINDEGKIAYGRIEDGYKEVLKLMAKWYEEGLLNPDFITDDGAAQNAHILNGDGGAFWGLTGSGIGTLMANAEAAGIEGFNLVGAPYPVLNEGDTCEFGQYDYPVGGMQYTVSPTSDNIEAAIRFLDYGYTEAGSKLYNYGREGVSYTEDEDGTIHFTDYLLHNPDGLSLGQAVGTVAQACYAQPGVLTKQYQMNYFQLDIQKAAVNTWSQTNASAHVVPPVTVSAEDAKEFNSIMAEVNTFCPEYISLAISGEYDLENFETEFVDVLKDIGIERAIEIEQAALDAFNAR